MRCTKKNKKIKRFLFEFKKNNNKKPLKQMHVLCYIIHTTLSLFNHFVFFLLLYISLSQKALCKEVEEYIPFERKRKHLCLFSCTWIIQYNKFNC